MKFNLKRLTLIFTITLVIAFFALKLPEVVGQLTQNQGSNFNSNFKNYNRILDIFDQEDKKIASFKIAIADSDEKKQYGLMNLKNLPENFGMLFTFHPNQNVSMWMKNTLIPLDIIFIDGDSEISTIAHNTTPNSLDIISSKKEVMLVLEINANLSKKLGLKPRQKVRILNSEK